MINPFTAITSKIFGSVAIAAITFGAIQTVRIEGLWFIDGYVDKLEAERTARGNDLLAYQAAQSLAAQKNADDVNRIETDRKELASASDVETRSDIDAAVAHARKLWQARAATRVASCPGASEVAATPGDISGAGGMPQLFTEDDVRICASNTSKSIGWQKFYGDLVAAEKVAPE